MLFQIKSYLKFLKKSSNQHGVHSPFVYNLITKCFYDKKKYPEYSILKQYRNLLLVNKNYIEVSDFGTGSRIFKSNKRQIAQIAKTAGISAKRAQLLFRVVHYFNPNSILELGTSLGLATAAIALGNKSTKITTLEGCANTHHQCQLQFQKFNFNTISCINTKFEDYLSTYNLQPTTYNLIYFDGNHSKQATIDYFEALLPTVTNETVWIFDDIHWSKDMEEAWKNIKNHPQVKVTIDTFQWGFVFFRKEQEKEHFIVRV